jgi:hypothetical protein
MESGINLAPKMMTGLMYSQCTHYLPLTLIQRRRMLPVPGRITVRRGQTVRATDTVAEANLAPRHLLLDLARGLGVSPQKADRVIQRRVGEEVAEGDVIAGPIGLGHRVVRAPKSGRVVVIGEGKALLELDTSPFELSAGIPGVVKEIIADRGVIVETAGALLQGVWGNGKSNSGVLQMLVKTPDEELDPDQLDITFRGAVICAGHCGQEATLETLADMSVRGLILGSMPSRLVPLAMEQEYPIVLLEGFAYE